MMIKNIFLTLSSVLFISACGDIQTLQMTQGKLDPNQVEKATDKYCSNNQTLKELALEKGLTFDELDLKTRLFAFIGKDSTKKCIIENALNLNYSDGTWISINPLNNCLKNGSIWSVESQAFGSNRSYTMKMVDDPSQRIMNLNGDRRIQATLLQETLGLTLLTCVNK